MTVTLYIIIGIVTALILMGVTTYFFLEDQDYDLDSEEIGMLMIAYVVCLILGALWPVVIAVALLIGLFYGFFIMMKRLLKALRKKIKIN